MKHFYTAPTVTLRSNPPAAAHHAVAGPDDDSVSLIVVDGWPDHASQDAWERLDGVIEHPPWDWRGPAHARLQGAFAAHGVRPGQTMGQAMAEIRRRWPVARP